MAENGIASPGSGTLGVAGSGASPGGAPGGQGGSGSSGGPPGIGSTGSTLSEQAQFEQLVQHLMSGDNTARMEAEETYDGVPAVTKIPLLVATMQTAAGPEVRSMAAVLLRRIYTSNFEEFWPQFPPEAQAALKAQMLLSIQQEPTPNIRKKVENRNLSRSIRCQIMFVNVLCCQGNGCRY